MSEQIRRATNPELLGGIFVLLGLAALLGELNPVAAEAIVKFWPTSLIGLGVAFLFEKEA